MSGPELHLVVAGDLGQRTGGYLYDAEMARRLPALGWTVRVYELEGAFPAADDVARRSLEGVLSGLPQGALVVIDGLAMGGLPGPVEAEAGRLRIVSLVHHPLADETGLTAAEQYRFERLEMAALAPCSGVIVTSSFTLGRLAGFGVDAERARAVLPGTEPARAAAGPAPGEPPRLLCVGTVGPRKGQDVLVRALVRLRDLPWTCVCAGSLERAPDYAHQVLEAVRVADLSGRIEFVGEQDALALDYLYHHASLFVLPSHYEGYGMALTEAMARGLPIVSTTGGAIPHTVPSDAGILVPPGEELPLTDALGALLSDRARRRSLAKASRRRGLSLPTWDQATEAFARALLELTPERSAA